MKILLSYSKTHFDPSKPESEHNYWGSSANVLARTLYAILKKCGDVTYVDAFTVETSELETDQYDLFVGVYARFDEIRRASSAKRSIFFAVNMHPVFRNNQMHNFVDEWKLPDEAICPWDIVDAKSIGRALKSADQILAVGNIAVFNSFIHHGVPKSKIKVLNYGVGESAKSPQVSTSRTCRYVHVASELGLRKGLNVVMDMVHSLTPQQRKSFFLDIVGKPTNEYYEKKIQAFQKKYPQNVKYHGWIDTESTAYKKIMSRADFVLFPALEEGQAGTVLDAIRQGTVPIVTPEAGIDYSPLGWLDLALDRKNRRTILTRSLALSKRELQDLKQKTLEYYRTYHETFEVNLRKSLKRAIVGSAYPKMSIVLPIFNKEHTILKLLQKLDRTAREYGEVEVHIIIDGCKDQTEKVVRDFYKNPAYPVTYKITPNIFEVKTNNMGLRKSTGEYGVIIQDDNVLYDRNIFYEAATFLDKNEQAVILGGLAGVNYYPRGTKGLAGAGQIAVNPNEAYWRQDADTDPELQNRIFEVDACMRGPLFFRLSFLKKHGYLDEVYAPLYQDDMDIAFRARKFGYKVFCILMNVKNESLTVASYSPEKVKFWDDMMKRNTDIFYKRWKPTTVKDYEWVNRISIEPFAHEQNQERRELAMQARREQFRHLVSAPRRLAGKIKRKVVQHG